MLNRYFQGNYRSNYHDIAYILLLQGSTCLGIRSMYHCYSNFDNLYSSKMHRQVLGLQVLKKIPSYNLYRFHTHKTCSLLLGKLDIGFVPKHSHQCMLSNSQDYCMLNTHFQSKADTKFDQFQRDRTLLNIEDTGLLNFSNFHSQGPHMKSIYLLYSHQCQQNYHQSMISSFLNNHRFYKDLTHSFSKQKLHSCAVRKILICKSSNSYCFHRLYTHFHIICIPYCFQQAANRNLQSIYCSFHCLHSLSSATPGSFGTVDLNFVNRNQICITGSKDSRDIFGKKGQYKFYNFHFGLRNSCLYIENSCYL